MPTYEYRCRDCGHEFEIQQSFADAALTECPQCHGNLRKVFGNVGITFKGSGFYKTDSGSRKGGATKSDTASSSSETKSDSSSSSSDSTATPAASPAAS